MGEGGTGDRLIEAGFPGGEHGVVGGKFVQTVLGIIGGKILRSLLADGKGHFLGVQPASGLHSAQAVELIQETLLNGLAVGVIPVGTLVCGIIQLEVCHGEVQEIFLHIEAGVLGVEKAHEHQTKGKGAEDKKGPFFVTPQIGPGHGGQGGAPPPFFLLLSGAWGGICVPQCFHWGDLSGQPGGKEARDDNGQVGK